MKSVWIFVITLIVILAAAGIIIYNTVDPSEVFGETAAHETEAEPVPETSDSTEKTGPKGERTLLLIGTDYQPDVLHDYGKAGKDPTTGLPTDGRRVGADCVMLIKISADKGYVMTSVIPSDVYLNLYSAVTVGSTYDSPEGDADPSKSGPAYTAKCVSGLTGLRIDAYIAADIPTFTKALEKLGKFTVNVPVDMKYSDPWQDLEIDLKRGTQALNAGQVMQLLRFNSYSDTKYSRESVALSFADSLLSKVTGPAFSSRLVALYKEIVPTLKTNYTSEMLKRDLEMLLLYPSLTKRSVAFPTKTDFRGNDDIVIPDTAECIERYGEFK